jgi:hypothetical protein
MQHPTRFQPHEIKTSYTFKCARHGCDTTKVHEYFGEYLMDPGSPGEGWVMVLDREWICPQHSVAVFVDGKVFYSKPPGPIDKSQEDVTV